MERRALIRVLAATAAAVAGGDLALIRARQGRSRPAPPPTGGGTTAPPAAAGTTTAAASAPPPTGPADTPAPVVSAEPAPPPRPPATTSRGAPATLAVVCRREWGAAAPTRPYAAHTLDRLTVHHTAVRVAGAGGAPARLRAYQRDHQRQGFADLAYHYVVDRDGRVFEGRPPKVPGETATAYDPRGHFLPCLEGNFEEQAPTPEQVAALVDLLAWACGAFGVDPATLAGHRSYAATACPGRRLQALVDDGSLREAVERRLRAGGVALARCR